MNNLELKAIQLNNIGKSYYFLRDYSSAILSFKNAFDLVDQKDLLEFKADLLNNIAGVYYMQNKYLSSLEYAKRSLDILNEIGLHSSEKAKILMKKVDFLENYN